MEICSKSGQSTLSFSETLSQSACVVTGGSAQATELANALQRSMSALDMVW